MHTHVAAHPLLASFPLQRPPQVLDLQGHALQILRFGVPLSGVCADSRHVVVTAVEPELSGLDMQAPKKLPPAVHMLEVCQQSLSFEAEALGGGS